MSYEIQKYFRRGDSPENQKRPREKRNDKELPDKKEDLFHPTLNEAMGTSKSTRMTSDESSKDERSVSEENQIGNDQNSLRDRLQEKLGELLDEEEALVELYAKAARAAKDKEEEYKQRIAELIDQTERDRQLMELFRNI